MAPPSIVYETREMLDPAVVLQSLTARAVKEPDLSLLFTEVQRRGYKPVAGPKASLGYRETCRADQDVKPPAGTTGAAIRDLSFELSLQSFSKPQSRDQAAVATVTISAGMNIETYTILLEAPNGNFAQASEFLVKNNAVVKASSWWTCINRCVRRSCTSACIEAAFTCSGTWAAYIWCFLAKCGSCGGKCLVCCTCNCKWWCRWISGCCRR